VLHFVDKTKLHLAAVNKETMINQEQFCLQIEGVANIHHGGLVWHNWDDAFCTCQMSCVSQSNQTFSIQSTAAHC